MPLLFPPGAGHPSLEEPPMARILLLPPPLSPRGGGVGVTVWMLQSLASRHEVWVLDDVSPDWPSLDRFYATTLALNPPGFRRCPPAPRISHRVLPTNLVRRFHRARQCRRIALEFDLCISLGECDFLQKGLQYVSFPWLTQPSGFLSALRWRAALFISGFSLRRMRENVSLTNSNWTKSVIREVHGFGAEVLYPPVHSQRPGEPWERRPDDFVAVGRGIPCKRFPFLIKVMRRLRERGWAGFFHIVSAPEKWARREWDRIESEARGADWVKLHQGLSRVELEQLLGRCRYGVHGMKNEHFGMAPAEMVRAGCLVFVPDNGGQVEIVGSEPALIFTGAEDAEEKIVRVLSCSELQKKLLEYLRSRADLMSEQHFMWRFQEIVQSVLDS